MNALTTMLAFLWGDSVPSDTPERLTAFRRELAREGALRDVEVDGYRYAVADLGKGPALVLLHGLGGSIYDWRHLIRPLAEGHRVVAIDLLGAGESDRPPGGDYSLAAQARRVRGILDALRIGAPTLVGNSYGGGVALRFAQDYPDRAGSLVLINSICYPDVVPAYAALCKVPGAARVAEVLPLGKLTRWVLRGCYQTVGRLSEEELQDYLAEIGAAGRRAAIVETLRAVVREDAREIRSRFKSVRAPALLIWGKADRTVPLDLGRRLQQDLPRARLVEVEAGHVAHQERPEEVLREIREFLKQGPTPPRPSSPEGAWPRASRAR